jgi:tRNA-dihydrouridine synthase B
VARDASGGRQAAGLNAAAPAALPIGPEYPWLAPLAGFSDLPFRLLCRELGAAAACTEMVSAKGLVLGQGRKSGATEAYLATIPPPGTVPSPGEDALRPAPGPLGLVADRPLVVQLFGSEPGFLERAVAALAARGYAWFDLNMGCSVPKVGRSGSGSAMLRDIPNALAAARAMIAAAGPGRVGFKLRLGWRQGEEVCLDLGRELEALGAGWLTLHPRYAQQKFTGRADWSRIARLKQAVSIPVIASGDLITAQDAVRCLGETGANGVMFARGALADPAVFAEYLRLARGGDERDGLRNARSLEAIIRRHAALARGLTPVRRNARGLEAGLLKMRTFVPRYVRRFSGARALRRALARCESWESLDQLLADFFRQATLAPEASP